MKYWVFAFGLICIMLCKNSFLFGQNIVVNPGFEQIDKYGNILNWKLISSTNVGETISEKNFGCMCSGNDFPYQSCKTLLNKIDGCNALFLFYMSKCKNSNMSEYEGCTPYVLQKLKTPLAIGDTFLISFWVYVPAQYYLKSGSEAVKHIGVLLTNKLPNPNKYSILKLNIPTINYDSFSTNKWLKFEKYIVPTCEINYITLGVFKESSTWLMNNPLEDNDLHYFLDKVSIVKTTGQKPGNDFIYYCNEVDKKPDIPEKVNVDINIYFENNSDVIKNTMALDTFAQQALKFPEQIYYLTGHADKTKFENNIELSKKRVENVIYYLESKYKIPKFRLIYGYFGDKKPVSATNNSLNRRVNIQISPIKKANACYREALYNIKNNNIKDAFLMLNCWISNEIDDEKILALFDPQFDSLKKDKRWKLIESQIKNSYKKYKNSTYAFVLDSLYTEDQRYRRLAGFVQDLEGYNIEIDTVIWDYPKISDYEWHQRDSAIYHHLKMVLDEYGFPKTSEVGKRPAKSAAVILIHSHDSLALVKYLPIYEANCKEGEGDWNYYATMYDKLCTLQGVLQRYGTQFVTDPENPDRLKRYKHESKDKMNEWRKKIAIPTYTDEDMNLIIKAK